MVNDWHLHPQLADDTHPIGHLGLSELVLMDDANYPWLILVPRVPDARELLDLDAAQRAVLMEEIARVSAVMQSVFRPHKLNVAALGNMVPQLHVHLVARQTDDPAWPAPVWGRVNAQPYAPEALVERVKAVQAALGA